METWDERMTRTIRCEDERADPHGSDGNPQMEEEGVPSTALREVSLLQMLSESAYIVR